ncbi:hypothetical protein [Pseudomonas aeruginosa]|nr:hypothetical protein [Pseudomonas aeruginosa]MBX5935994.1 hypothetical protein [Pseudomonas aeruginosa]MCV3866579.1 hypothetical protein [Pseudomonas aeruginosa]MCV3929228.1 hypothetical protein [Pseudomonas aeruginosa]
MTEELILRKQEIQEKVSQKLIEDICSGLLIPDTDLGENPCRERGA